MFSGLSRNGLSLRPQYALLPSTTVAIEARSYVFDATSRPTATTRGGGFGNREQQLGISLSTYLHQYYLNSSAYPRQCDADGAPAGQSVLSDRTPRNYWTTNAGWSGVGGVVELQTGSSRRATAADLSISRSCSESAASRWCCRGSAEFARKESSSA